MREIPVGTLRELLRYEPETGKLYWLERPVEMFEDSATNTAAGISKWWNGRFAGKEAFTARGVENCRTGRIFGQLFYAHRVVWALHYGAWPPFDVDHEDGDRSNNRIGNLRDATHQQNMQNKKLYANNRSGATGVSWHKRTKRWAAGYRVSGKRFHVGYFDTVSEAVAARAAATGGVFHANHGRSA